MNFRKGVKLDYINRNRADKKSQKIFSGKVLVPETTTYVTLIFNKSYVPLTCKYTFCYGPLQAMQEKIIPMVFATSKLVSNSLKSLDFSLQFSWRNSIKPELCQRVNRYLI